MGVGGPPGGCLHERPRSRASGGGAHLECLPEARRHQAARAELGELGGCPGPAQSPGLLSSWGAPERSDWAPLGLKGALQ